MIQNQQRAICQICIIFDVVIDATHNCEVCHLAICDDTGSHDLDHPRIDADALRHFPLHHHKED